MTADKPLVVTMSKVKETPGTIVYNQIDSNGNVMKAEGGAMIPSLYIRKEAFDAGVPQRVEVTVKPQ